MRLWRRDWRLTPEWISRYQWWVAVFSIVHAAYQISVGVRAGGWYGFTWTTIMTAAATFWLLVLRRERRKYYRQAMAALAGEPFLENGQWYNLPPGAYTVSGFKAQSSPGQVVRVTFRKQ